VIDIKPLNYGLAVDLHGQLIVFHRSKYEDICNVRSGPRNMLHNFHFKIKGNQVDFFLQGSIFESTNQSLKLCSMVTHFVLDCIIHEADQSYYVLTMISWRGYPLYDYSS